MNTGDSVEMTWPFFPEHAGPKGEGAKVSPDAKGPEQGFRFRKTLNPQFLGRDLSCAVETDPTLAQLRNFFWFIKRVRGRVRLGINRFIAERASSCRTISPNDLNPTRFN